MSQVTIQLPQATEEKLREKACIRRKSLESYLEDLAQKDALGANDTELLPNQEVLSLDEFDRLLTGNLEEVRDIGATQGRSRTARDGRARLPAGRHASRGSRVLSGGRHGLTSGMMHIAIADWKTMNYGLTQAVRPRVTNDRA